MASRLGPPKSALAPLGCTVGQEDREHLLPFSSGPEQVCTCMGEEVEHVHSTPTSTPVQTPVQLASA